MTSTASSPPLVLVGSDRAGAADEIVARLRRSGSVAYAAHSLQGCLRVATAVGPDVVLLEAAWSPRLERMLRSHPTSRRAQVLHISEATRAPLAQLRALPA